MAFGGVCPKDVQLRLGRTLPLNRGRCRFG